MIIATFSQKRNVFLKDFTGFAQALTDGAIQELLLTPKPGLVDRADSGSHPDLSFEIMEKSVNLLPAYYQELGDCCLSGGQTSQLRTVALAAEKRMLDACGSNTHKGYIFLSGLALLAHIMYEDVRTGIKELSAEFFKGYLPDSNGSEARRMYGTGGIIKECMNGLPSVFEAGIPALSVSPHYALACIMERSEDSTSLHRCGQSGLETVHRDGKTLKSLIENGQKTEQWLDSRNEYYKRMNLTMGGCADLLALSFALIKII
ncbi:MAG: triphosphoribosyl-dephospho-CoA synthase [Deferribacterales bacterium]